MVQVGHFTGFFLAALNDLTGDADHHGVRGDWLDDDSVSAYAAAFANFDSSQDLRPSANNDVITQGRVPLTLLQADTTQREAVIKGDIIDRRFRLFRQ